MNEPNRNWGDTFASALLDDEDERPGVQQHDDHDGRGEVDAEVVDAEVVSGPAPATEPPSAAEEGASAANEAMARETSTATAISFDDVEPTPLLVEIARLAESGQGGALVVAGPAEQGVCYVERGAITHATSRRLEGTAAFLRLASLREATVSLKAMVTAPYHSIQEPQQALLEQVFAVLGDTEHERTGVTPLTEAPAARAASSDDDEVKTVDRARPAARVDRLEPAAGEPAVDPDATPIEPSAGFTPPVDAAPAPVPEPVDPTAETEVELPLAELGIHRTGNVPSRDVIAQEIIAQEIIGSEVIGGEIQGPAGRTVRDRPSDLVPVGPGGSAPAMLGLPPARPREELPGDELAPSWPALDQADARGVDVPGSDAPSPPTELAFVTEPEPISELPAAPPSHPASLSEPALESEPVLESEPEVDDLSEAPTSGLDGTLEGEAEERAAELDEAAVLELMDLLSRLEQKVDRYRKQRRSKAAQAIELLGTMSEQVLAFVQERSDPAEGRIEAAVEAAAARAPLMRLVRVDGARVATANLHGFYRSCARRDRAAAYGECTEALLALLEHTLAVPAAYVDDETDWASGCRVLLDDARALLASRAP